MDEFQEANRQNWEERAALHPGTDFYDVDGFLAGASTLKPLEREELGDVAGKSLLHLQCHFGLDTLSWAREGATVTGVDFSETAIEKARELRDETGLDARFIAANIYDLPAHLDDQFDIVFTSYGVLYWLPDIEGWAAVVAHFLAPGGTFYIAEIHPYTGSLASFDAAGNATFEFPYFHEEDPLRFDEDGSYADPDAEFDHATTYEWFHSMSDILTALLDAGLDIEFVHEHPFATFQMFPTMEQADDGWWYVPGLETNLPFTFSLKATKPAQK
ncbi:bifunctional 2-polyprenyl-6-hydroxyphenol methylase/3-demethylubiquinol 3-O-methyltransferase UbiG [Haladaptatus sp. DYSN1]|uniref:class I SAM-dependent methyltransferase n=1 Tax=unclassified Haladaptatus TaxID=2622732 RepID=UPI0024066F99|nr:class I SAM-dependent methyltransferase [Haladaptatus sp. DYSN1]